MSQETLKSDLDALKSQGNLPISQADISALAIAHQVGISDATSAVQAVVDASFDPATLKAIHGFKLDPVKTLNEEARRRNAKATEEARRVEAARAWFERNWSKEDYERYVEKKGNE